MEVNMKILVVGAGPAGLSTAINASKEGHDVLVFEKDSCLGSKVCGEALGREALDFVGIKPSSSFINNTVKGFSISFKGEFVKEAMFKEISYAPGYVIDKQAFLEAMLEKAVGYGAKVFFNQRVERIGVNGKIQLQNGEIIEGDLVVCADGAGTLARKHLNYASGKIGLCMQYRCSRPANIDQNYLYLDIIGEGYAWMFPKGEYANIGIGLLKGSPETEKHYLDGYLRRYDSKPIGKVLSAPVYIGGPLKRFRVGKIVVVGEAAGCVMPMSGEGIRFAIYGGSIAWLPSYRRMFMEKYGNNMVRSLGMFAMLSRLDDKGRLAFLRALQNPIEVLEGKTPKFSSAIFKPYLLKEVIKQKILFHAS
jgi:digeranylgeranylglycerophospholipid reductase